MLASQLYQVGPATPISFGLAAISWQELAAWAGAMRERLTPFKAECLMLMSRAYVGEFNRASGKDASAQPIDLEEADEAQARRKNVAQMAKAIFGAPRAQRK